MDEIEAMPLYKRRSLRLIISRMNEEARLGVPGLESEVFKTCVRGPDGSNFALFSDFSALSEKDKETIKDISDRFDSEIQRALKSGNPMKWYFSRAISVALWNVPGLFKTSRSFPFFSLKNKTISPIYMDMRVLSSHPAIMNFICSAIQIELEMVLPPNIEILLGGETAGIPFADWTAAMMNVGAGIARKEIKGYGTKKGIEGSVVSGGKAVIIEDMITDGGSKEIFIRNAQAAGLEVVAVIVVFDRQQGGGEFLEGQFGVPLISLTDMDTFLEIGKEMGYIDISAYNEIIEYLADPKKWNAKIAAQN